MSSAKEKLCRICLQAGADIPIFLSSNKKLYDTIQTCLHEKIEEIEGFPKHICLSCIKTINLIKEFITKYQENSKILHGGLVVLHNIELKSENRKSKDRIILLKDFDLDDDENTYNEDNDNSYYVDGGPEIKIEFEEECFIKDVQKDVVNNHNFNEDNVKKGNIKNCQKQKKQLKRKNSTNKITCCILEGSFVWKNNKWCRNNEKSVHQNSKMVVNDVAKTFKLPIVEKWCKKKEPPQPPLCDECGSVFQSRDKLRQHKLKEHELHKHLKCPYENCSYTSYSKFYFDKHTARRHGTVRNIVCDICNEKFAFKSDIRNHIKKHLPKNKVKRIYSCSFCDKKYYCRHSVVLHERSVHTGERPVTCKFCNKNFACQGYLTEHMRLHTGETPFKCPICGRGYAQSGNMKSHLRNHRLSDLDIETKKRLRPSYFKYLKP